MTLDNLILLTDSYKPTHPDQYERGTTEVYSYMEARSGAYPLVTSLGDQYFAQKFFTKRVTTFDVHEAVDYYGAHFGTTKVFDADRWRHIVNAHGGLLPLSIRWVPEGTQVPLRNVLRTVVNTDPACYWLPGQIEGLYLQTWYPSTVATQAGAERRVVEKWLERTGDPAGIDFKVHDFGFRGCSSPESAAIGGLGHLVYFKGTDTVPALWLARNYYGEPMAGYSILASEHSTITSWGREREVDAYRNLLSIARERGLPLYACVSDSYDLFHAITNLWGGVLRDEVLAMNGTLVIRPDSGDLFTVVPDAIEAAMRAFGYTKNAKGFAVLPPQVRFIQGDGIKGPEVIDQLYKTLWKRGLSADNLAVGEGGGKLQGVTRDTCGFAFKASHTIVNGQHRDVFKDPATGGGKASKRGYLALQKDTVRDASGRHTYHTVQAVAPGVTGGEQWNFNDQMVEGFRNGELLIHTTLAEIRARAQAKVITDL